MANAPLSAERFTVSRRLGAREHGLDVGPRVVAYIVLTVVALAMFVPFAFALATSLKTNVEANRLTWTTMLWPANPTLDAYRTLAGTPIERWFFNSALVAAIWIVGRVLIDSMAGYAFARMRFPGRDLLFVAIVSTLMVPPIVLIIPKYILLKNWNMLDSYLALTVPFLADAFGIFLMKQFFEAIPAELEDAARIDGASRYRMFAEIALPNAKPALAALAIFSFQGSWNAFLEPLIYISRQEYFTLPLGLAYFRRAYYTDWPVVMAIAVVTTLPLAIFFVIFQRWFIAGVRRSGITG
jgi:multiple sugar transport system permease protein